MKKCEAQHVILIVLGIPPVTVNMHFLAEEAGPARFVCCYTHQKILVLGTSVVTDKMSLYWTAKILASIVH